MPYIYNSKKGTFTNVTPVAGFDNTAVIGLADNGTLAGSGFDVSASVTRGLIIDQKGKVTVFDHPDAASFTQARGVNNKGLVTGFRDSATDSFIYGFIYDSKKGTFTNIVPSFFTLPQGINSRGDVVGSATFLDALGYPDPCDPAAPGSSRLAWLRTSDGTVTYFDVNGWRTSARAITDSGKIAGWASDPRDGTVKGFVVELDGSQCQSILIDDADLLQCPGAAQTFAQGIKNTDEVTGYCDFDGVDSGFIARPQKGKRR